MQPKKVSTQMTVFIVFLANTVKPDAPTKMGLKNATTPLSDSLEMRNSYRLMVSLTFCSV